MPQASPPLCGSITIECDRPLPSNGKLAIGNALDVIGMPFWQVQSSEGRVRATYTNEGEASLVLCATNLGGQSCSNRFPATLPPTFCPAPPPPPGQMCPTGFTFCGSPPRCVVTHHCDHLQ